MARLFISHKETDARLARAAVGFLLESLDVLPADIFCSSLPGHALKFGATIESQIRTGIQSGDALIALLTKDSVRSTWVLFELGAAWGLARLAIPILGTGLRYQDLPASLAQYPCISADEPESKIRATLSEAIEQLAAQLKISRKNGGRQVAAVDDFLAELRTWTPSVIVANVAAQICPNGYEQFQTQKGYTVFRSSDGGHCICPTCYNKENKIVLLQGDITTSVQLVCKVCKATYRLKDDPPIQYRRQPGSWMAR